MYPISAMPEPANGVVWGDGGEGGGDRIVEQRRVRTLTAREFGSATEYISDISQLSVWLDQSEGVTRAARKAIRAAM
jgi:hypothetical protein